MGRWAQAARRGSGGGPGTLGGLKASPVLYGREPPLLEWYWPYDNPTFWRIWLSETLEGAGVEYDGVAGTLRSYNFAEPDGWYWVFGVNPGGEPMTLPSNRVYSLGI